VASSPLQSPVVVDGVVSSEKLAELMALGAEYPELDFKEMLDPTTTEGIVELAVDVGAFQVRGGYIVAGVDNQGAPTGRLDAADISLFDEARLRPKLLRYLPEPLELRTVGHEVHGHTVVVIFVGQHPHGCAIMRAVGQYRSKGKPVVRFRAGDVFWRDGTSSMRMSQQGLDEVFQVGYRW
jgi:hypothetical protein